MKPLKGTPKQVKWAEEIRQLVVDTLEVKENELIDILLQSTNYHKIGFGLKEGDAQKIVDQIISGFKTFIEQEDSASKWIEYFKIMTSKYSDKSPLHRLLNAFWYRVDDILEGRDLVTKARIIIGEAGRLIE